MFWNQTYSVHSASPRFVSLHPVAEFSVRRMMHTTYGILTLQGSGAGTGTGTRNGINGFIPVHTSPRQEQGQELIASYCVHPIPCTIPGPGPVQPYYNPGVFLLWKAIDVSVYFWHILGEKHLLIGSGKKHSYTNHVIFHVAINWNLYHHRVLTFFVEQTLFFSQWLFFHFLFHAKLTQ